MKNALSIGTSQRVVDFTYVATWAGVAFTAFVTDVGPFHANPVRRAKH